MIHSGACRLCLRRCTTPCARSSSCSDRMKCQVVDLQLHDISHVCNSVSHGQETCPIACTVLQRTVLQCTLLYRTARIVLHCSDLQVVSEALYDTLRTKQQLGYTVSSGARLTHGVTGFCVVVVSAAFDAATVEQRVEAFLHDFQHTTLKVGLYISE